MVEPLRELGLGTLTPFQCSWLAKEKGVRIPGDVDEDSLLKEGMLLVVTTACTGGPLW